MTEENRRSLYATVFPEHHESDREAKEELLRSALPMEKRFSKNMLQRILHFLEAGYIIKSYNEYQSNGLYKTVLGYGDKEKPFVTKYVLPQIGKDKQRGREGVLKEKIEELMAKMSE